MLFITNPKVLFLSLIIYSIFLLATCSIPSLSVKKVNTKLIEKKRQETLEMCRLFNEENSHGQMRSNAKFNINNGYPSNHRIKRDINSNKIDNPVLKQADILRVEKIVDKLYDDMEENGNRITYRQRNVNNVTKVIKDKLIRRLNFAPAQLFGPIDENTTSPSVNLHGVEIPWIKKWKHAILPYFIDPNTYDSLLSDIILKAFDYIEKVSCIRLQRLREKPTDKQSLQSVEWLYISNPSGVRQCVHSNEHKPNTGVQMVVLGYDCLSQGEIAHEVMHVLGFSHEHTRADRDRYITILWDNIKPGYKKYFETRQDSSLLNLPYDYASVLHYPPRAFSKNGQITVMAENKKKNMIPSDIKVGQRDALSELDVEKIGTIYGRECVERNNDYLLKTCPSVVKVLPKPEPIKQKDIEEYFKDRVWPYGIVNFQIKDILEFTSDERENLKAVFDHIEKETCIEFRDITKKDDADDNDKNTGTTLATPVKQETEMTITSDIEETTRTFDIEETTKTSNIEETTTTSDIDETTTTSNIDETTISDEEEAKTAINIEEATKTSYNDDTVINKAVDDNENKSNTDYEVTNIPNASKRLKMTIKLSNIKKATKPSNMKIYDDNDLSQEFRRRHAVKPTKSKKTVLPKSPSRRHAANILKLVRSTKPGCQCPPAGRPNGNKELIINADCFNSVNDLLHLFVHALGLDHQHNMYDRDSFLHIEWGNLPPEITEDIKAKLPPAASAGYTYDYQSVMHYPWLQIKDGVTNIMYPIWNDGWAMGQWQGLSWADVQKINHIYTDECLKRKQYTQ